MSNLAEKLDDKLENAIYLLDYGMNIIKSEKDFKLVLDVQFTAWQKKLLQLDEKNDWFDKIKSYSNTFQESVSKGDKEKINISKQYPPLDGDALKIQKFTKEIMGEWNGYIQEDLVGLSKQMDGLMVSNFNVSGQDFVGKFYKNLEQKTFNLKDKSILNAIEGRADWLSERASSLEWERITRKTADWFYFKGKTPAEMRKWISASDGYKRTYKGRSENIARTEVAWSQTQATNAQMVKSEVPFKKFITEPRDEWPCDLCEQNEGDGVIRVEDSFTNGDVPVHPECKCAIVPVVPKDWSPVQEWYGEGNIKPEFELLSYLDNPSDSRNWTT